MARKYVVLFVPQHPACSTGNGEGERTTLLTIPEDCFTGNHWDNQPTSHRLSHKMESGIIAQTASFSENMLLCLPCVIASGQAVRVCSLRTEVTLR